MTILKAKATFKVDADFPLPPLFRGSGVYAVVNRKNGLIYVGGTRQLAHRWRSHCRLLALGKHPNKRMQADWKKYGQDWFHFVIIQECTPSKLLRLEQRWIDRLKVCDEICGYNRQQSAKSNRSGTKDRPEATAARTVKMRGRKLSETHKARIRAAILAREVKPEWGRAISIAKTGQPRPDVREWAPEKFRGLTRRQVIAIRRRYVPGKVTFRQLASEYGCTQSTIYNAVNHIGVAYRR